MRSAIPLATLALASALAPGCAARRPRLEPAAPLALTVAIEDHSRQLKRLRPVAPGEANTGEARAAAIAEDRDYLETNAAAGLVAAGFTLAAPEPAAAPESSPPPGTAPVILALRVTTLGEVRARYILIGIASGVAWGVGTGLLAHNPGLALGLGLYELIEETIFWIGGASLFSRWSAPVMLEASLANPGAAKPFWRRRYPVLSGRKRLRRLAREAARRRDVQLRASLDAALEKLLRDLGKMKAAR